MSLFSISVTVMFEWSFRHSAKKRKKKKTGKNDCAVHYLCEI